MAVEACARRSPRPRARLGQIRHRAFLAPAPHRGRQRAADHRLRGHRGVAARPQSRRGGADPRLAAGRRSCMLLFIISVIYPHAHRHAGDHRGLRPRRSAKLVAADGQHVLLVAVGARRGYSPCSSSASGSEPWRQTASNGSARRSTAAPIRSRTTPMTWSWSAPAARACAPWSAAARPACKTACITKVFPTRSHTVAAQGGIAASLGNMGEDDWRWHMYDTVKGVRLARRPGRHRISVPQRARGGLRARALGPAVLAPRGRRQDLSAPVRRHDHPLRQGHRAAHLRGRRPHRPRHAAHACTAQALRHSAEFFIEYFAIDLIMDEDGRCRGVVASSSMTARSIASAPT